jgi:glycosyltransferase involved in cell wall biosynthesis
MKISVVIAAYNASATLGRAIRSVLAQTRPADEIIVVDDGSTDTTADIVRQFGLQVRLITQPNGGVSVARNTGIQHACGDWIAFLDADDQWLPEKLAVQAAWFKQHPDICWGYGNFIPTESYGRHLKAAHPDGLTDVLFADYFDAYCRGFYAWTSVLMIRKDIFSKAGLFEPGMKRAQDNDLWFRIAYQFPKVGYIGRPLAIYHLDTPGSSTKVNVHYEFMIDLVNRHLELSKQYGRYEAFWPCIRHMVEIWIRELIWEKHYQPAKELLDRFEAYLLPRFCREVRFRLRFRRPGSIVADGYLKFKDILRGRRGQG